MGGTITDRFRLALQRPDLAWRKLCGKEVSDISMTEISPYLPTSPVILEAGAYDGTDTVAMLKILHARQIYSFEPVPAAYNSLREKVEGFDKVATFNIGLAESRQVRKMHISTHVGDGARSDSSSLLEPTEHLKIFPGIEYDRQIDVECVTIDDWLHENEVKRLDFMWLDLQGMELAVLRGSQVALENCSAVMMEVYRKPLYAGVPLYPEVCDFMRDRGFIKAIDRVAVEFGNILFVKGNT